MGRNRNNIERISTGSDSLDGLLLGGLETHAVTEFYGPSGVGKTQLCHTLTVNAILNKLQLNKKLDNVIYVDTEAKFRPERLISIAQARGFGLDSDLRISWLSPDYYGKNTEVWSSAQSALRAPEGLKRGETTW
jgi:RecA/RadA recombinase